MSRCRTGRRCSSVRPAPALPQTRNPRNERALLPCEPVIARDVLHKKPARAAPDELDAESVQTGKRALGRCDQRHLPSAVDFGEESAVRERDLADSGGRSPEGALLLIR